MRTKTYEMPDPRIATTEKRCKDLEIIVGKEQEGKQVTLLIKNIYLNAVQRRLLNHLNFTE